MFALGLLAILQITALPGAMLTMRLQFDTLLARVVAVFCTSLVFNYAIVLILTLCHHYQHNVVLVFVAVELLLLAWQIWRATGKASSPTKLKPPAPDLFTAAALTLTTVIIAVQTWLWWNEIGDVFSAYDAIASWNRWAVTLAKNQLPVGTYNYPQLLPANWSLAYVITDAREGELFARAVMGAFPSLILVAIADLQRRWRQPWLAASAALAFVLLNNMFNKMQFDGMADIPVAAVSFAGLYFLLLARDSIKPAPLVVMAGVALGASCVTKQAGLFISVLAIVWVLSDKKLRGAVLSTRRAGLFAFLFVLFCMAHWYGIRMFTERSQDGKLVGYLTNDIHQGRGLGERMSHGLDLIYFYVRSPWFWGAVTTALAAGLSHPLAARLLLNFTLPFLMLWLLSFSYDIRNIASIIPTVALCAGLGCERIAHGLLRCFRWVMSLASRKRLLRAALLSAVLTFTLISFCFSNESVTSSFRAARRCSGNPELNRIIREQTLAGGQILTSYLNLTIQPGMEKRVVYAGRPLVDNAKGISAYPWIVVETKPSPEDNEVLQRLIKDGLLQSLGASGGFVLYRNTLAPVDKPK
ncbi:MAG: hypothetical protein WCN98_01335 [Verrucomicrobiaceae bacterium]